MCVKFPSFGLREEEKMVKMLTLKLWLLLIGAVFVFGAIGRYDQHLPGGCSPHLYNKTHIECLGFFPSFNQFVKDSSTVHHLKLGGCKYSGIKNDSFKGLTELEVLEIFCDYNGPDETHLVIEIGSFESLNKLNRLYINDGNFTSISASAFCNISNLRVLNLNGNRIESLTNIGLQNGCVLDVPRSCQNHLSKLYLAYNLITVIPNNTWVCEVPYLEVLVLSHNFIEEIPPFAFSKLTEITDLLLRNNKIRYVHSDAFHGLVKLNILDLSENLLTASEWINDVFRHTPLLEILSVANNILDDIDGIFNNLENLLELDLNGNRIEQLSSTSFSGMKRLEKIFVIDNKLIKIDIGALPKNLVELYLLGNRLSNLKFLKGASNLRILSLSENRVKVLDENLANLTKLRALYLRSNYIKSFEGLVFANLTKLRFLDLSNNLIRVIKDDSFKHLQKVDEIRLDRNHITSLTDNYRQNHTNVVAFSDLNRLRYLNLSRNHLTSFNFSWVPPSLIDLDVSRNKLQEIVSGRSRISHLDLSYNKLTEFNSDVIPRYVQTLLLNNNHISYVDSRFFLFLPYLMQLTLHSNNISKLDELILPDDNSPLNVRTLTLADNPWHCDCNLKWLLMMMVTPEGIPNSYANRLNFNDADEVKCTPEFHRNRSLVNIPVSIFAADRDDSNGFACRFITACFKTQKNCTIICPPSCSCYRSFTSYYSVVCSSKSLSKVPFVYASEREVHTYLYLDRNNITRIGPEDFEDVPFLRILDMSLNGLQEIQVGTFDKMLELFFLYLEHNSLTKLDRNLFRHLSHLVKLDLSHNRLSSLDESIFDELKSMKYLYLQHNLLISFPVWTLSENMPSLAELSLHRNPWSCDCEFAGTFANWLIKSDFVIQNRDISCISEDKRDQSISLLAFNASHCYNSTVVTMNVTKEKYVPILVSALVAFSVVSLAIFIIFIYRREMQVLIYSQYGVRLFYENNDAEDQVKNYDAFVSYTSLDEEFLVYQLLPGLEQIEQPYRLCLYHRDFMPGSYIQDSIMEAVMKSRRTILLLTENFVLSEWCRLEFKVAHIQMLKDRRNRVIVILIGKIPENLDPEMKLYLKTNIYLTWGEKLFWQKLYFALPEKNIRVTDENVKLIEEHAV